jgi:aspartate racemase
MATTARKIGLIGGLALRAGIFYYEQILHRYAAQERRLELVLAHADVSTVLACVAANDSPALGRYLGTIANELFNAGAELVAVTAIAPHLAIEEIMRVARGPMVNVLDVIPAGMATVGLRRVAVFGNRTVMETRIFGTLAKDATVVLDQSLVDEVHATYTDIALHGKRGTQPEVEFLEAAARKALEKGAEAVLLAGTDLSSFYAEKAPAYPFLDIARLHIDRIVTDAHFKASLD